MLKIYTTENSISEFRDIKVDSRFPEIGLTPWEQIEWIESVCDKNISIITLSPYILNHLNALIIEKHWTRKNLEVVSLYGGCGEEYDMIIEDDKGKLLIDVRSFSDPIMESYRRRKEALGL